MKRYSISELAGEFKLSRSTLLHYDAIGLLEAGMRTGNNYRVYTEKEYEKLTRINSLRKTGISLEQIGQIITSGETNLTDILHKRINQINEEIKKLRFQQNIIVKLLNNRGMLKSGRIITKDMWVGLLKASGLDEAGMRKWHMEFERSAPEAHQDFLEHIGLSEEEIKGIRNWAKKTDKK